MAPDLLSAIGSLASVAVAVIASVVAYFAWKTSKNSAAATAALTDVEKARWHAENRPEFHLELEGVVEDNRIAACSITFVGSKALDWVDVVASVRPRALTGPNDSDEDAYVYVWDEQCGYYSDRVDTKTFRLPIGGDITLWMIAANDEEWQRYTRLVRLWLHCTAENGDTWMVAASCKLTPLQLAESIVTRESIEAESERKWGPVVPELPVVRLSPEPE
jgi:hypothetical protein